MGASCFAEGLVILSCISSLCRFNDFFFLPSLFVLESRASNASPRSMFSFKRPGSLGSQALEIFLWAGLIGYPTHSHQEFDLAGDFRILQLNGAALRQLQPRKLAKNKTSSWPTCDLANR